LRISENRVQSGRRGLSGNNGDMRNGCKIMLGILVMTGYWGEIVEVARFY